MKNYEENETAEFSKGKPFGAWIGNLGKYNEGVLAGEWVRFPTDRKTLDAIMKRIGFGSRDEFGCPYEETFIADYDWYLPIKNPLGEWESFEELNYLAKRINEMTGHEYEVFCAAADSDGGMDSAKDLINLTYNLDCYSLYPDISSGEDIGRYYFDEFYDNKEALGQMESYIDFESYGRDCRISEGGTFTDYGYVIDTGGQREIYNGDRNEIPEEYRIQTEARLETVKGKLLAEARVKVAEQKEHDFMTDKQLTL